MPRSKPRAPQQTRHVENVPVSWLLKAFSAVLLAAAACIYAALCFLYSHGQWQIVLHPVRATGQPPASVNVVHFAPNDAGQPQLTGQWLTAQGGERYSKLTILFLPGGDGSLSSSAATIAELQGLGLNVFAFDYRGYGFSADLHPSQQRMTEDVEAAWRYLTATRGVSPAAIIPYGTGVGASLAASLAATHKEISALVLDSPYADLLDVARHESPASLPVSLLFRERFPLRDTLSGLRTPKLLLATAGTATPAAFATAVDPKLTVFLPSRTGPLFDQAISRFLDESLNRPPVPSLAPSATNPR
jgi:pimeloyl-ACP methyl ester carboxylesterase